jgi:hypothetical protein
MGFVCMGQFFILIIIGALTNGINKKYKLIIYWFSASTFILTLLFLLAVCPKVTNKIVIDIFPICFISIHTIGILLMNYLQTGDLTVQELSDDLGQEKTRQSLDYIEFCDQIGSFNLLMAVVTLLFLRVNWFFTWVATIVMFITTTVIITVSLKTSLIRKREDAIILLANFLLFLASYCFEYLQIKYWL